MSEASKVFGKSYFTHDFDAHNDHKCRRLRRWGGFEAYGRWWMLLELFGDCEAGIYDLTAPLAREDLADELDLDDAGLTCFLDALSTFGLIDSDAYERGHLASEAFLRRQDYIKRKAEAGKKGMEARWKKDVEGDNRC